MSSSRNVKPKSKEMTWSESELAKHVLKDQKKLATTSDGKVKSSSHRGGQRGLGSGSSGRKQGLSSTVPGRESEGRRGRGGGGGGGRERLSSTTAAATSGGGGERGGRQGGGGGGGEERRHKREEELKRKPQVSSPRLTQRREKEESKEKRIREERRRGSRERGREDPTRRRQEKEKERIKERDSKGKKSSSGEINEKISQKISKRKLKEAEVKPHPMKEVREGEEDIIEEEEEDDFEYEDDFEDDDYVDDDFEDDIEEEEEEEEGEGFSDDGRSPPATNPDPTQSGINLVEIMKAIEAENEGIAQPLQLEPTSRQPQLMPAASSVAMTSSSSQESQGLQRSTGRRIYVDFSSAKTSEERERVAKVTKKRGRELLSMIELDVVTFDLFELRPLSEYELYMRSFGLSGTRQVGTQTGEDTAEVETQTEVIEGKEKWVQWPPEDLRGYGGGDWEEREDEEVTAATLGDAARLTNFLKRASRVVCVLLEENSGQSYLSRVDSNQSQIPFCSTKMTLEPPVDLLGDCTLTSAEFSHAQPHLVMTIHVPKKKKKEEEREEGRVLVPRGGGAVCVWSTREPSRPQYLLVSQSPSTCGCFGPHTTPLIFSATEDGSVLLWDLRETVAMHTRPPGLATPTDHTLLPRAPTYSTAGLVDEKACHQSPVVSLLPISSSSSSSSSSPALFNTVDEPSTIGLSFQLASLDRSGLLIIWVAVETKPHPQGSESDLGLIPNGRVKLVQSSVINTISPSPHSIPTQTVCFQFHSTDSRHIFLGTDEGYVLHRTRYSNRPIPRRYQPQTPCPCDVTSLSLSPWQPDYFLAGYSNGSISLYHTKKENALLTWIESTNGIAVCKVEWAWHYPGMFVVLDTASNLYLWNLLETDRSPIDKFTMTTTSSSSEQILSFSLSPSSSPSSSSIALCLVSRRLEIHTLSSSPPHTTNNQDKLEEQLKQNFTNYLNTL